MSMSVHVPRPEPHFRPLPGPTRRHLLHHVYLQESPASWTCQEAWGNLEGVSVLFENLPEIDGRLWEIVFSSEMKACDPVL